MALILQILYFFTSNPLHLLSMPVFKQANKQFDGPDEALELPSREKTEQDLHALRGNAFIQEQLKRMNGDFGNSDRRLGRAKKQLNDASLQPVDRAKTLLNYRNSLLPSLDAGSMLKMRDNEPDMPVYGGGERPGMMQPLYEQLAQSPNAQTLMADLAQRITQADTHSLNIHEIWDGTRTKAQETRSLEQPSADSDLDALRAMATLANYYKVGRDEHGNAQLPEGISPELWAQIDAAGTALATSPSADAAVMSRGIAPQHIKGQDFTSDRNFHFFSHAYLTAALQHQHNVSPERAKATSGFIGTQYELKPSSFQENSGNAGLKDILVNAEGSAFGSSLMNNSGTNLPTAQDGPAIEDRSWPELDGFDTATQKVLDKGNDLSVSGILKSIF